MVGSPVLALVKQHFFQKLPAIGLFVNDRLIGIALIAPPQRRLGITESWAWQLRMWLSTGVVLPPRWPPSDLSASIALLPRLDCRP